MIALVSTKGSPGVTTTALALTLTSPGRCLLAECDPAGGDILAGYLQGALAADRGLAPLAVAELRGRLHEELDGQLVDLDAPRRERLLLPGVADPAQSATVAAVWEPVAAYLRRLTTFGADEPIEHMIVDCGRLSDRHFGKPLLHHADLVLLVVRGGLPSVSSAVPAVAALREELAGSGGALGLLVVEIGPYRAPEVARRLGVELVAAMPEDPRAAQRLSFGGTVHHRMPLLRAASRTHDRIAVGTDPAPQPEAGSREVAGV